MGTSMKANGTTTNLMEKELTSKKEIAYTKVNFYKVNIMAKVKWNILMEINIKVRIKMEKKMGRGFIHGQMETIMMANGRTIVRKGKAHR